MLKFGNKEFRNLQEQVEKNMKDILFILQEEGVLNEFGIKVVGQEESAANMPTVEDYKENNPDWAYGDAYAIGTEDPYELYILTRANGTHASDYWFNIGEFPVPGPQGPQGEQGPQGPQGQTGPSGADGASAGFGTITATAVTLEPSEDATVSVVTSGTNVEKNFAFTFGIPKGETGETPTVEWGDIEGTLSDQSDLVSALQGKQNTLVSGTNIKTINNESILGSGNITIEAGGAVEDVEVNGVSVVDAQGVAEVTVPTKVSDLTNDSGFITSSALSGYATESYVQGYHDSTKQDTLVSGTNIKTINNESILGSGNIVIQSGGGDVTDVEVNGVSVVDQDGVAEVTVPTKVSDLTNDSGFITSSALSGYATESYVQGYHDSTKQDVISDLATIRSGAALGATAVQPSDLATVATTGDYDDLIDKPNIPTNTSDLTNDSGFITSSALSGYATETWVGQQGYLTGITSSDVTTALGYTPGTSNFSGDYDDLTDKPDLSIYAISADLATVADTGSYDDLTDKPDLSIYAESADLATVATSGSYNDLTNKPVIPDTSNLVTTNTTQTISGVKTFSSSIEAASATINDLLISNDYGALTLSNSTTQYQFDIVGTPTNDRTIIIPDKAGTIALTSDIPSIANLVTTNTVQTITGAKTFDAGNDRAEILIDGSQIDLSWANGHTNDLLLKPEKLEFTNDDDDKIGIGGDSLLLYKTINNSTYSYTLPNTSGTLALTSDIPSASSFVTVDTTQTITGAKSFTNVNGISAEKITVSDLINTPTIETGEIVPVNTQYSIALPQKSGTIALTNDIPSTSNLVTTNTTQTITSAKTFEVNANNAIILKRPSAATRVGISLQNTNGNEYGFFQHNTTTGYTVFGASTAGDANNKLAFRYFGSDNDNKYNVIMPGSEKYTAIGAGDVNLPLAAKIGSSGTPITASAGGLITLPSETWTFTLSDNTTVTKKILVG